MGARDRGGGAGAAGDAQGRAEGREGGEDSAGGDRVRVRYTRARLLPVHNFASNRV